MRQKKLGNVIGELPITDEQTSGRIRRQELRGATIEEIVQIEVYNLGGAWECKLADVGHEGTDVNQEMLEAPKPVIDVIRQIFPQAFKWILC